MEVKKGFAGFSTSRTILHAARNGHISISRQRALACRQEGASRDPSRSNWPYAPVAKPSEILATKSEHRERTGNWCVAPHWQCCGKAAYLSFHLSSSHLSGALAWIYLFCRSFLRRIPSFWRFERGKLPKSIFFFSPLFCAFWGGFCPFCSPLSISNNPLSTNVLSQKQPFANSSTAASSSKNDGLWSAVKHPFLAK